MEEGFFSGIAAFLTALHWVFYHPAVWPILPFAYFTARSGWRDRARELQRRQLSATTPSTGPTGAIL